MTRKEEIRHKAGSISGGMIAHNIPHSECKGYYEGYIDGAKYADKTMIDKAKAWVKNYFIGPFGEELADNIANEFAKHLEE